MEIALSDREGSRVYIWCDVIKIVDGVIHFDVINGAWEGTFDGENIFVIATKSSFPGKLLWFGKAKGRNYNEAIPWIEEQLKSGIDQSSLDEFILQNYNEKKIDYFDEEEDIPF